MIVTDDFNRANETPIAGNWTALDGIPKLVGNEVLGGSADTNLASYTGAAFGNNQSSQITILSAAVSGQGPSVRLAALRGYLVLFVSGSAAYLYRLDSNENFTLLQTLAPFAVALPWVIKLAAYGTGLTAYQNAVSIGTTTDGTYASGAPGWVIYGIDGDMDTWQGTDVFKFVLTPN
jgi:hypothetical protein